MVRSRRVNKLISYILKTVGPKKKQYPDAVGDDVVRQERREQRVKWSLEVGVHHAHTHESRSPLCFALTPRGCHSLSLCHTQDVKRQEEAARKEEEAKRLQEQETEMKAAVEAVQEKRAQIRAEHRRAMKRLQAQEILMTRSLKGDDKLSRAREGLESIPRDMYKGKASTAVANGHGVVLYPSL